MGKLILGDGLLGSELERQTSWDCISRKRNNFDIDSQFDSFFLLNEIPKYDTIINCIAHTDTYSESKEKHWSVNYSFVHKLIQFCNIHGIKLVHISTDYIYTHSKDLASENDVPVHCNNWYGYTKLLGDGLVQLLSENYLLIRCTHKPNPFPYELSWIDQIGNFDYVDIISKKIIQLVESNQNGVFNVGTELKSMYDLAKRTKDSKPAFSNSQTPKNVTMCLDKINNLNLK